jgi:hypothetical protein
MSTLQAALALAAKGCAVFPIHRGTKKPAIRRWPDLATADPERIRTWWARWPDANVGVHTRGLLVLDIDGPIGHRSLLRLRRRHPLPPTLTVISGNLEEVNHYQLVYKLPPGLRAGNKPLDRNPGYGRFDKIDVRSTRGQVVGPGSIHASGGTYRWKKEPKDVYEQATQAPEWAVLDLCQRERARVPAGDGKGRREARQALPEPGCDEEILLVLRQRFPITGPRQRQSQMSRAVGWLASKRIPVDRIIRLAGRWLAGYRGVYKTAYRRSFQELHALVHRTRRNLARGNFLLPPDHQELSARAEMLPELKEWLCRRASTGPILTEEASAQNVLCSLLLSVSEEMFVEALLLHYQYEFQMKGAGRLLMTDRQLMAIHEHRFGSKLNWRMLGHLKSKFFTRWSKGGTVRKASRRELLVLERPGRIGQPSVYAVTGLPPLDAGEEGNDA